MSIGGNKNWSFLYLTLQNTNQYPNPLIEIEMSQYISLHWGKMFILIWKTVEGALGLYFEYVFFTPMKDEFLVVT